MAKPRNKQQVCKVKGCGRIATVRDWCNADYQQVRRNGHFERVYGTTVAVAKSTREAARPTVCGVSGCDILIEARGLCPRHYTRFRKYGDPLHLSQTRQPVRAELPDETSPAKLGKLLGVSRQRAHQLLNKTAHDARHAVAVAVKDGRLVKPDACERCRKPKSDLEAHHWDYHEQLDVRWLCTLCHSIVHPHHPLSNKQSKKESYVRSI